MRHSGWEAWPAPSMVEESLCPPPRRHRARPKPPAGVAATARSPLAGPAVTALLTRWPSQWPRPRSLMGKAPPRSRRGQREHLGSLSRAPRLDSYFPFILNKTHLHTSIILFLPPKSDDGLIYHFRFRGRRKCCSKTIVRVFLGKEEGRGKGPASPLSGQTGCPRHKSDVVGLYVSGVRSGQQQPQQQQQQQQ